MSFSCDVFDVQKKYSMNELITRGDLVLPGDVVADLSAEELSDTSTKVRIGPGLMRENHKIVAIKAGILHTQQPATYWVETFQRRYVPIEGDSVIGIIKDRHIEHFKVDIGTSQIALLPVLAFEGATKRNRPNLQVGDLIYARLVIANRDLEPELSCVNVHGKSDGLGELKDGYLIRCSLVLSKRLQNSKDPLLLQLAKQVPFEMASGMNGRIWINAEKPEHIFSIVKVIEQCEYIYDNKIIEQSIRSVGQSM